MPLYDLHCQNCDFSFDDILPMKADGPFQCPQCKQQSAVRIFSIKPPLIIAPQEPGSARTNRGRIKR